MPEELNNLEKTVLAHLTIHHRIQPSEPTVVKIFGGDQGLRRKTLTSLRDRGYIQHFRRALDNIEFICPSDTGDLIGRNMIHAARKGSWQPENISLGE